MSNPENMKEQLFYNICNQMAETYVAKNRDYGDSFGKSLSEFGIVAALVRMQDKFNRIKSLTLGNREREVKDEAVEDTLLDLANYAVMTLVELEMSKAG